MNKQYGPTLNWIKSLLQLWVQSIFMYFGHETIWYKFEEPSVDFWISDALLVLFAGECVSTGLMVFFFSFFFSGKPPAGPVCGITPQDPSRAGSQKRNSCQTMNYCSVTRQVRFWGVDEEAGSTSRIAHTRSHTHSLTCIYIHRFVFILGHIHKLMRSHTQRSKN